MKEVSTDDLIHKQEYMVLCNLHGHKQQLVKELESVHLELQTEKQRIEEVSTSNTVHCRNLWSPVMCRNTGNRSQKRSKCLRQSWNMKGY